MTAPSRRAVLGAGLVGGAAALTGCTGDAGPANTGPARPGFPDTYAVPAFDPGDWDSVREQFPLDPSVAQFAAFVLSPHPAQVDAAIAHHRQRLAFDTEAALLEGLGLEDAVRQAAAEHSGGDPGQYALTDSTTMGLALLYGGLALDEGDEVLTTTALRQPGIVASSTPYAVSYLRLGPSIVTSTDEVDRAIEAITALV